MVCARRSLVAEGGGVSKAPFSVLVVGESLRWCGIVFTVVRELEGRLRNGIPLCAFRRRPLRNSLVQAAVSSCLQQVNGSYIDRQILNKVVSGVWITHTNRKQPLHRSMATTMKGLLKGLRYITLIFDEEKEQEMQIGFPTNVRHVAHIGSDSPATITPSWMSDFKPQEHEKGQVLSRGNSNKYNPQGMNQHGAGIKDLLPSSNNEKPKQKTRHKPVGVACPNLNGSPTRQNSGNVASSDEPTKQSRHNRSKHGSIDSLSDQDPSVRRRRGETEVSNHLPDSSAPPRKATSHPRKLKGSVGGEASMKKSSKEKPDNSI